jgi:cytochrome c-type biogenesis protein CcmH/NrfG
MTGAFSEGLKVMHHAEMLATGKREQTAVQIGFMRVFTLGGKKIDPKWLENVEKRFQNAIARDPGNPEPYFFMGVAYKKGDAPDKAAASFARVIEIKMEYEEEARKEIASM